MLHLRYFPGIYLEGLRRTTKIAVRIIGVPQRFEQGTLLYVLEAVWLDLSSVLRNEGDGKLVSFLVSTYTDFGSLLSCIPYLHIVSNVTDIYLLLLPYEITYAFLISRFWPAYFSLGLISLAI